ncbi:hypothetical protein ACRAVF_19320 [Bradyrhizobium oligotrophicum S58]
MIGLTGIAALEAEMGDRLAAKNAEIDQVVRERETYNGYHQAAVMELDRVKERLAGAIEALEEIAKLGAQAHADGSPAVRMGNIAHAAALAARHGT